MENSITFVNCAASWKAGGTPFAPTRIPKSSCTPMWSGERSAFTISTGFSPITAPTFPWFAVMGPWSGIMGGYCDDGKSPSWLSEEAMRQIKPAEYRDSWYQKDLAEGPARGGEIPKART